MPRYNPFRPGSIVTPGMFCGRYTELELMEQALFQTKNGNPQHFLIHGERGIGKSSLLFCIEAVARGGVPPLEEGIQFNFLVVNVQLEPSTTYFDIIRKIGLELQRVAAKHKPTTEKAKAVWNFIKRWEVAGVKYKLEKEAPKPGELLDELTLGVEETLTDLGSDFDGILILIDEADKAPRSANLGQFVKVFTERLSRRGCNRVCLGLAGISTLLDSMKQSHESSLRIFQIMRLEPLLPKERIEVVKRGLGDANKKNSTPTTLTDSAGILISHFSEGYPHFIQQFAYSAFDVDKDNNIGLDDVVKGAYDPERGALQQLGEKYFQDLYLDQIQSDEYRRVLRSIAGCEEEWASKEYVRQHSKVKETTLNNALSALTKRNIVIAKKGAKGYYKLPTHSFGAWIKTYTADVEGLEQKAEAEAAQLPLVQPEKV